MHHSDLATLHADILACRRCAVEGWIPEARPVVSPRFESGRLMLIGQAPGQVEAEAREPFMGRAGRVLLGWMVRIGLDEETFRRNVYITSVTKCFPGKSAGPGGGDRRPSPAELRLCRPWLDRQIALLDPRVLLLAGRMAIDLYLPAASLDAVVGHVFQHDGRELIPLPHPSGMSRWLNAPANRERLNQALELIRERLVPSPVN